MDLHVTPLYRWYSRILGRMGIRQEKMDEFLKFALVGGIGVVVNMGIFWLLTRQLEMRREFASPIAIELSILSNFVLNNLWTFRRRNTGNSLINRLLRYHLVTAFAGIVNYLVLLLLANVFGLNDMIANLIGIVIGAFINFFLNSMWTWRVHPESGD